MSSAREHSSRGWHVYCKLHVTRHAMSSVPMEPVMLYRERCSLMDTLLEMVAMEILPWRVCHGELTL